ncbi:MAG TPA: hypothetical protein DCZ95_10485 [Verrucomicrobia bacterium]|nr:hypothetical protein [Verrucomicrobiota bacterium]
MGSLCAASEIAAGDSLAAVMEVLGPPPGEVAVGSRTLLYYERGRVELWDGKVVAADLISPQEADARRIKRQQAAELARKADEERRAQLKLKGRALLEKKLSDPAFLASPAGRRAAFWENFMRDYPDVPVQAEYAAALAEQRMDEAAQRAEEERAWQMTELQRQVDQAEQRAYEAEARSSYASSYAYNPIFIVPAPQPQPACETAVHQTPVFVNSRPHYRHDDRARGHRLSNRRVVSPPAVHRRLPSRAKPLSALPRVDQWPKVSTPLLDQHKRRR